MLLCSFLFVQIKNNIDEVNTGLTIEFSQVENYSGVSKIGERKILL